MGKPHLPLWRWMTVLLVAALLLTGCAGNGSPKETGAAGEAGKGGDGLFKIRVQSQTGFNEFWVAEELGYLKEEGIQLEYVGLLGASQAVAAILSGDNDLFMNHPDTIVRAILSGAKLKITTPGILDSQEFPHMVYFTKEGSGIRSPHDLAGKKVGVSSVKSCPDLVFTEWLRQNHLPKDAVEFVVMPDKQQEQALKQGLIDVATLHPPWIKRAQKNGGVTMLTNSFEVVKSPAGGSSVRGFSEKFIQEHPDIVIKFNRAMAKARKWINQNRKEAEAIVAQRLGIKPEDCSSFYFDENDWVKEEYVQAWLDMMIRNGELEEGKIQAKDLYTNEYNPYYVEAKKQGAL
ncbi:ABC transporter substrate-binding protein [Heliobacterium gestii]|uniref:ABC transporter substrate-binding protein n=1 Tax=Heliomicrobium gestii TaxID=2699 RepID=A0A845L5G6_HELGE|nr:ABC transporter substrate-binding protein [Heliomicrobium gestii]MBM7865602.1 ABC-type nitrate/sulfonate/bicarbonate transport system substrate-binding protein [Heliomicrobium gestii]MZP41852.1 ABC transporter substrate-binding protein [Heliomicrobium gestii]